MYWLQFLKCVWEAEKQTQKESSSTHWFLPQMSAMGRTSKMVKLGAWESRELGTAWRNSMRMAGIPALSSHHPGLPVSAQGQSGAGAEFPKSGTQTGERRMLGVAVLTAQCQVPSAMCLPSFAFWSFCCWPFVLSFPFMNNSYWGRF